MTRWLAWGAFLAAAAGAATAPMFLGRGDLFFLIEILVVITLAQSWNLLAGYAGLLSLGHHAFVAVGGYALFVVTRDLPVNPYVMVPLTGFFAAALALALAPILFRLRDVYFAVGMWVAAEALRLLFIRWDHVGGISGMPLYAARQLTRATMTMNTYWLALAAAVAMTVLVGALAASTFGLRLRALRDDEVAARSIGVGPQGVRLTAFVISAAGAGIAGSISFLSSAFINPASAFDINWVVTVVFVTIIGGIGRLTGPFLGAALYFLLRETLAFSASWYLVALGVTAMLVMLFAPGGLAGLLDRLGQRLRPRRPA